MMDGENSNGAHAQDLDELPAWQQEAERLYVTREVSTLRDVAARTGANENTIFSLARRRRWTERRREAASKAAQILSERIDEEAATALADQRADLEKHTLYAGRMAARLACGWLESQSVAAREALAQGKPYKMPRGAIELLRMAHALAPKEAASAASSLDTLFEKMLANRERAELQEQVIIEGEEATK